LFLLLITSVGSCPSCGPWGVDKVHSSSSCLPYMYVEWGSISASWYSMCLISSTVKRRTEVATVIVLGGSLLYFPETSLTVHNVHRRIQFETAETQKATQQLGLSQSRALQFKGRPTVILFLTATARCAASPHSFLRHTIATNGSCEAEHFIVFLSFTPMFTVHLREKN
jgi:hypothetical protein